MKKTAAYNKTGIAKLADDKPIVYRIQTPSGKDNYVGVAKRGRASDRIAEHLGEIPGSVVKIVQHDSLADAKAAAQRIINRCQPKYNQKGQSKVTRHTPLPTKDGSLGHVNHRKSDVCDMVTWFLLVMLECFILATLPFVWPIWVTVVVLAVMGLVPSVLFANLVHSGNLWIFPWSYKIVIPKTLIENDSRPFGDLRGRPIGARRGAISRVLGFLSWPIRLLLDFAPAKLPAGENPPVPSERFRPDPPTAPPTIRDGE